jgi:hypothetical protein
MVSAVMVVVTAFFLTSTIGDSAGQRGVIKNAVWRGGASTV